MDAAGRNGRDRMHANIGLNYHDSDGSVIRYDNENGKGDHKHIVQAPRISYEFVIERLIEDFFDEGRSCRSKVVKKTLLARAP